MQLAESYDPNDMYGKTYGYHSSLNASMVAHLREIRDEITQRVELNEDDLIIDIGSNDGTLLSCYLTDDLPRLDLVGVDPSGGKFLKYYPIGVELVEDFFSETAVRKVRPKKRAKVITSIAMFYDLENPIAFATEVGRLLREDGIWVMEQSYLPLMIASSSYDTICHEHIEFYSLKQIDYIAERSGLKVIDVSTNDTNGGSFRVTLANQSSSYQTSAATQTMRKKELADGVNKVSYFANFNERIQKSKN